MDKTLSVVIPTYNMERYLHYCLDSLCVNRNKEALEVLIINDGSTDSSLTIAHEYENKRPEIFRVIDKSNGNYGSCVNRGLSEATGKYIKILDADDSFDTVHFEEFLSFLKHTDADLVLSDFAVVDTNRTVRKVIRYEFGNEGLFDMDEICRTKTFKYMQMHAVTYRRKHLLDMDYHQTEGISYTDQQWIFMPMIMVRTVACFSDTVYKYLIGREGQTINPTVKLKSLFHTVHCALGMVEGYEHYKKDFKGKPVHEYLYARMLPMVKGNYVAAWQFYGHEAKALLTQYDEQLLSLSHEVYDYIAKPEISSFKGFRYISYWREHKDMNAFLVRFLSRSYVMLHDLRQSLHGKDKMAVPASF